MMQNEQFTLLLPINMILKRRRTEVSGKEGEREREKQGHRFYFFFIIVLFFSLALFVHKYFHLKFFFIKKTNNLLKDTL